MSVVNTATGELLDTGAAERRAMKISLRLDAIAENYQAVMPMIREAIDLRDDLALGYRSVGDYVADRFGQALSALGMELRRDVVRELTAAGLSSVAIAPVVGVTDRQVRRDAGRTDVRPDSPPVTGIDGKTYRPPSMPPPREKTKEEIHAEEIEHGIRSTVTRIAECVRFLDGGEAYGRIFLEQVYPHEQRILAHGMQLTQERIDSCIEFLTTVREGVTR